MGRQNYPLVPTLDDQSVDLSNTTTAPGGSPLTTKGDLFTFNGATDARFAAGADGQVPTYLASEPEGLIATTFPVSTGVLAALTQSSFTDTNGTLLTAYTPDVGASFTFSDVKILTGAAAENNDIQSNQANINTANTGATQDLAVSDCVMNFDWIFTTGDQHQAILRYNSDGNMLKVNFGAATIAVETVVSDVVTSVNSGAFVPVNGTTYKVEIRVVGIRIIVLVDGTQIVEAITSQFLTDTQFGIGAITGGEIFDNLLFFSLLASGTGGGRPLQEVNNSYFVRTTGNDGNDGLTVGTAFLTIQKGVDVASSFDIQPNITTTVDVGAGTFAGFESKTIVGQGSISVQGAGSSSTTINSQCSFDHDGLYLIGGIQFDHAGNGLNVSRGCVEMNTECEFGPTTANVHMLVSTGCSLALDTDYSISGDAFSHLFATSNGIITSRGGPTKTVTLSGTPAFSGAFARSQTGGVIDNNPGRTTYAGTGATGERYRADSNSIIFAPTGGATFYPGSIAGVTTNGGVYIP